MEGTLAKVDFRGLLLGIAVADAFGGGVEWQSREWMREHVKFDKYINSRPGNWAVGFKEGMYTDDTEMNIGVVKALIAAGKDYDKINEDTLIAAWLEEYNAGKKKYGKGRQGHGAIQFYFENTSTLEEIRKNQSKKVCPGNAPSMRVIPFCFLPEESMKRLCIVNSDTTHPHPKVRASCLVIARAARHFVIERREPASIIRACIEGIETIDEDTYKYLMDVDRLPDHHTTTNESEFDYNVLLGPQPLAHLETNTPVYGLGSDAMRTAGCALYLLKHYQGSPFGILKDAVWIGGDVGSLAAICLGIAGAAYGLADIPSWLIEPLEDRDVILKLADEFLRYIKGLYSA